MKILVVSDLHAEIDKGEDWSMPLDLPKYDVAVVAGDVDRSPLAAIALLANHPTLRTKPCIYVPGNHEFWGEPGKRLDTMEVRDSGGSGGWVRHQNHQTHYMNLNTRIIAKGRQKVRFVACTLWTPDTDGDDRNRDYAFIKSKWCDGRFTPEYRRALHDWQRGWIERQLAVPFAGQTVVVTHHPPPAKWNFDGPALWIHGHTHLSVDRMVNDTRVVCNAKGCGPLLMYRENFENENFNPRLVVDVRPQAPKPRLAVSP